MITPLVTILVNLYNGERYLPECLDSILALDGGYPLQIVVVDDASTDATPAVMARYTDQRIEYLRLDPNVGSAAAINRGFDLVRGEYLARIDYDDRYHRNFLVDSMAALLSHPEAAFVCANAMMIDPESRPGTVVGPRDYGEAPGSSDRFRPLLERHFVTAPTILARTSAWRRAIPLPAGMNFCDWYMNLTMAETAPVVVLDKVTADYRIHPLGMHATHVKTKAGERITWQVLDRFLDASPRTSELAPHARRIRAIHSADWGDKYFGIGESAEALRCYRRAIALDSRVAFDPGLTRRIAGAAIGQDRYEWLKSRCKRLLRA